MRAAMAEEGQRTATGMLICAVAAAGGPSGGEGGVGHDEGRQKTVSAVRGSSSKRGLRKK